MTLSQSSPRCLPNHGKSFRQNSFQTFAVFNLFLEIRSFTSKLAVGKRLNLRLKFIDFSTIG